MSRDEKEFREVVAEMRLAYANLSRVLRFWKPMNDAKQEVGELLGLLEEAATGTARPSQADIQLTRRLFRQVKATLNRTKQWKEGQ